MNCGAVDEHKSDQSTAQNDHKDEESNSCITEQRTLQQQRSSRGRRGGALHRRMDQRNWPDRRDQRVNYNHISKPLPSRHLNQSHRNQDERLNRDQEIVGFLNRKLKHDKQVVTDTSRSSNQEEQHAGVLVCDTNNGETNFDNKEDAISGQKEFDRTIYGKKSLHVGRQKETIYNNRGRGQRGRQNFAQNFVSYPRISQKSHIKYHGEDYNDFNNSVGQNYGGSRNNFNQTKNKSARSKKVQNRDQTSRSNTKLSEDEAGASSLSDKSEISNTSNHHGEFSDRLIHETSCINNQSKVNNIGHTTMKPGEIFMHDQSLGAMKKHSDSRPGLSRNCERNSYGRHRRNFNERMKPWRQVKNSSKFQSEQAGALIEQLRSETYECMVCYDGIKCSAAIWSCSNCYHVFHLKCIRKWANSPSAVVEGKRNKFT